MSNQYRAKHRSFVATFGEDVFDHEFDNPTEERDYLERGWVELEPRPYRTLIDGYTVDGKPVARSEVIEAAFPMEIEAALISGGVLERVRRDTKPTVEEPDQSTTKKAAAKRTAAKPKE